jgi:Uma2 family endonuclease
MVAMTDAGTLLPSDRPLTVEDLYLLPDDGNRYELDDGLLVVSPAPVVGHQAVVHQLGVMLEAACPAGFVVLPGSGVEMSPIQYRVPDLVVVRADDASFGAASVTKPPVLAIEVASPSTAVYDRNRKKDVYAEFGIASYWIVVPDLEKPKLTAYQLHMGRQRRSEYALVAEVIGTDPFRAIRPFSCEVVPAGLIPAAWRP